MTEGKLIFWGIDLAKPGGDLSCECEWERGPDGEAVLKSFRTWKHDLELEANKPALPNGELGHGKR